MTNFSALTTDFRFRRWLIPALASLALFICLLMIFPFNSGDTSITQPLGWTLWSIWRQSGPLDDDNSYCMVVPFMVLFIIWEKRKLLARAPLQGISSAVLLLIAGLVFFWVGSRAGKQYLGCIGVELILAGLMLWQWGVNVFRIMIFAWILIIFAWPLPYIDAIMAFPMRLIVCHLTYHLLNGLGFDCIQVGTALYSAPDVTSALGDHFRIDIADPCSGLHSLKPLLLFSALYSHFFLSRRWSQWLVFILTFPLIIVGNVVRMFLLVMGCLAWGSVFALGTSNLDISWYHELCGYMVFVVVFGVEIALGFFLTARDRRHSLLHKKATEAAPANAPLNYQIVPVWRSVCVMGLSLLILGVWQISVPIVLSSEAGVVMTLPDSVTVPGWTPGTFVGKFAPVSEAEHTLLPADTEFSRKLYTDPLDHTAFFSIVLSGKQQYTVHPPQVCLVAQGWTITREEDYPVTIRPGHDLIVRNLSIERNITLHDGKPYTYRAYYMYWYVTANATTPSQRERNWMSTRDRIFGNKDHRWAYMIVMSPISRDMMKNGLDEQQTKKMMSDFIRELIPQVQRSEAKP
jgi:exosortase